LTVDEHCVTTDMQWRIFVVDGYREWNDGVFCVSESDLTDGFRS
jgi:hypothetical protein